MTQAQTDVPGIDVQISEMRDILRAILDRLDGPKASRSAYTVEEAAAILGKKSYTVREWCRGGRVNATKRFQRRGGAELWNIDAAEVTRIKDEGLLPPDPRRNT